MNEQPNILSRRYIEALVEELAVDETRYEQAETSYKSVGSWLNRDNSTLTAYDPTVYVQGSFALGTVIKPLHSREEYDIDAVCELIRLGKGQVTQAELKEMVRVELELYRRSQSMTKPLEESRRCWTLRYADGAQFHMDVVPAVPNGADTRQLLLDAQRDASRANTAIAITDNEHDHYRRHSADWPRSNPKGYLDWFRSWMTVILNEQKEILAKRMRDSVDDIPDYRVRTPLQSSIMLLKRHRDMMYEKDEINCAPISIILTTLSAHAYNGERDIADALYSILGNMDRFVFRDDRRRAIIPNPADPLENFADKWEDNPEREQAFYAWLEQARADFAAVARQSSVKDMSKSLSDHMGTELAESAASRASGNSGSLLRGASAAAPAAAASTPSFANTPSVPSKPKGFA